MTSREIIPAVCERGNPPRTGLDLDAGRREDLAATGLKPEWEEWAYEAIMEELGL